MRSPIVTIVTTSYNHENYIGTCLQSVIDQTYKDWEQIIVDDASTDETFKILSMYAKSDKRIRIFRNNKNFGIGRLADNYNKALKMSRGKYIAILEGDDYWPKDKLERQIRAFNNKKVVFSYGDCTLVNKSGYPIKLFTYNMSRALLNNNPVGSILSLFYNLNFSIIPVTVMIRKINLIRIGGFKKNNIYPFIDIPTFLKLTLEGKFLYINEILGYYRKHKNSQWFEFASKSSAMGRYEVKQCVVNFIKNNKKNKYYPNFDINKFSERRQSMYLKCKRVVKPLSILVNKMAFKKGPSAINLFFVYEFIIYNIRKKVSKYVKTQELL